MVQGKAAAAAEGCMIEFGGNFGSLKLVELCGGCAVLEFRRQRARPHPWND